MPSFQTFSASRVNGTIRKLYYYWHCGSAKRCSQRNVEFMKEQGLKAHMPQDQLEQLLEGIFKPLRFGEDVSKWMQDVLLAEHREKSTGHKEHVAALRRRHQMLLYKNATPEKKRRMVEVVSSNLTLRNGSFDFSYRKPFDVLVESGGSEKWSGWRALP